MLLDTCFTGDVGGMRHPGQDVVNMPIVPPETDLLKWRQSLRKIRNSGCTNIAVSHFGIFPDLDEHLLKAEKFLIEVETWLVGIMSENPDIYALRERYSNWLRQWMESNHWNISKQEGKEFKRETNMGADGLFRYWHKNQKK